MLNHKTKKILLSLTVVFIGYLVLTGTVWASNHYDCDGYVRYKFGGAGVPTAHVTLRTYNAAQTNYAQNTYATGDGDPDPLGYWNGGWGTYTYPPPTGKKHEIFAKWPFNPPRTHCGSKSWICASRSETKNVKVHPMVALANPDLLVQLEPAVYGEAWTPETNLGFAYVDEGGDPVWAISYECTLTYEVGVMEYISFSGISLSDVCLGPTPIGPGKITFSCSGTTPVLLGECTNPTPLFEITWMVTVPPEGQIASVQVNSRMVTWPDYEPMPAIPHETDYYLGDIATAVTQLIPTGNKLSFRCVYPNPFNLSTTIDYFLPQQGSVELKVYDIQGRLVTTLVDEPHTKGGHAVVWNGRYANGSPVASGVYFARLESGTEVVTRKILLLK
jgi:hypothetical protein